MRWLTSLILLFGCIDKVEDDLAGSLVQVTVNTLHDECEPARFSGEAGAQFFGDVDDGGVVFTMAQNAVFGPTLDGGQLVGVQRLRALSEGEISVGRDEMCLGTFASWERADGGLILSQQWPGIETCPTGPVWLPLKACASQRFFAFSNAVECPLRCVRITQSSTVECSC